ncbi:ISAs1 family transposase [Salmonella enterica]|nr:ISAs1 family transposase [Salmonella enterica]EJI6516226.1 ISAs1 family transposase [Salmonella enterica]EJI6776209.1 ISAs1 family transposase [Salmonella enterica]EJK2460285.1 ISAs1 family transposase [Salmonella enterica]EKT1261556.1 ISAs1 family transposase [Salmonella enterica]
MPELIKLLDLKGSLVTIDAMACQTNIAKTLVEQGADYLLAVKNNQGKLRRAIEKVFASQRAHAPELLDIEREHGRIESFQFSFSIF